MSNPTPQGELTSTNAIRVVAILDEWLRRAAVRVIQEGPDWVIYAGNKPRRAHTDPRDAYLGALNMASFLLSLTWDDDSQEVDHD